MGKETKGKLDWQGRVENLEDRLLMSADPIGGPLGGSISHHSDLGGSIFHHQESRPDFWIEETDEQLLHQELEQIEQALANAHNQTGQSNVIADYGFDGSGQTVAIIDSGIAYDHYALGGGFGEGYRVVGGWDFTGENDANPYDDGPSGSHGTHVAGIVGADGSTHNGVATGVDLVGLRVFDDAGAGYFSWVEDSLQWIHDNRNSFENPITAVNLSLGVASWNADSIPNWAMLEDEFAQLEADGIFISVSAGNAFTSYDAAGLSYPAASSYVVPVMSVDDNGSLSYFSQRHSRAIAAPGRTIVSTVPDYAGNNNGTTDDWAIFSGTSMAAPYLAGASVLIREAMEFVGYTNINQDMIYDHIVDTSDQIWDSTTNAWYNSLNLEAAIDGLMPTDDFGSTIVSAFDLGTLSDSDSVSGVISTLDDLDYFTFTSGVTGTVTFAATNMTHDLLAEWQLDGGGGEVSGDSGETFTFDVVAGQEYTLSFASAAGLGYYDFDITSESSFSFIDLGAVTFNELAGTSSNVEQWYRIEATNAGFVSFESFFDTANGQINLHLFDANMQEIAAGNGLEGVARVDAYATAGEELFVCVLGTNAEIDLRMSNLVSLDGTTVQINGTDADDVFSFTAGTTTHSVTVNDVTHQFAANSITNVTFDGGEGSDSITLTGTAGNETATLRVGEATLSGVGYTAAAIDVESVVFSGGGGMDVANIYDSAGYDRFYGHSGYSYIQGDNYYGYAEDFTAVYARSVNGGADEANLYDTAGDDRFYGYSDYSYMTGDGYYNYVGEFEIVLARSINGGYDEANLYDSVGDDRFFIYDSHAYLRGDNFLNYVSGFDRVHAFALNGGYDEANMYDSPGDDLFYVYKDYSYLRGSDFFNYVGNFERVHAFAFNGGYDLANLYDTAGDDNFYGYSDYAYIAGDGFLNYAGNFEGVFARSMNGGNDVANLYDSSGNDQFYGKDGFAYMRGDGFLNYAGSFGQVYARAINGGYDEASLYDSAGDDVFIAYPSYAYVSGTGFLNYAAGFNRVYGFALAGGYDQAYLYGSVGDDAFRASGSVAHLSSSSFFNYTSGFENLSVQAGNGGNDSATLTDAGDGDDLYGRDSYLTHTSTSFIRDLDGFDYVLLEEDSPEEVNVDMLSTDYVFEQVGI